MGTRDTMPFLWLAEPPLGWNLGVLSMEAPDFIPWPPHLTWKPRGLEPSQSVVHSLDPERMMTGLCRGVRCHLLAWGTMRTNGKGITVGGEGHGWMAARALGRGHRGPGSSPWAWATPFYRPPPVWGSEVWEIQEPKLSESEGSPALTRLLLLMEYSHYSAPPGWVVSWFSGALPSP